MPGWVEVLVLLGSIVITIIPLILWEHKDD